LPWERELAVIEATRLVCSCAHRLVCALEHQGEQLSFLAFFDNEPDSETHGDRVRGCLRDSVPGCGERLGLITLSAPKPSDQPGC
jgi:hypothetical protein